MVITMKIGSISAIILALALTSCTTVKESQRVSVPLTAQEFNSISSSYMGRPTFVSLETMSDGAEVLSVEVAMYANEPSAIRFLKTQAPEYQSAIDKYLEWNKLAKSRGDAITKDIKAIPVWNGEGDFSFHSGNTNSHYLSIAFCAAGTCLTDRALYFDERGAKELKRLLGEYQAGSLKTTNIESVYK